MKLKQRPRVQAVIVAIVISIFSENLGHANGARSWANFSCQQAKDACIGSGVCVAVTSTAAAGIIAAIAASLGILAGPLGAALALDLAADAACSVILSGTSDFCLPSCPGGSGSGSMTYCTPPGATTPITDPTLAGQCCQPSPNQATALPEPLPPACPQLPMISTPPLVPTLANANTEAQQASGLLSRVTGGIPSGTPSQPPTDLKTSGSSAATTTAPLNNLSKTLAGPSSNSSSTKTTGRASPGGGMSGPEIQTALLTAPSATRDNPSPSLEAGAESLYQSGSGQSAASAAGLKLSEPSVGGTHESGMTVFGADDGGISPMQSEDPEDYFTRTGLDESLFKKVHTRYDAVSIRWNSKLNPIQNPLKSPQP